MIADSGFESLDHTADLKIRAWAPDLRGLIEQAARGMISLMVEGNPSPVRHVKLTGSGEDAEQTLVDCLREILLLPELSELYPVEVAVTQADGRCAVCTVGVVPIAEAADIAAGDIKAATYHDIEIRHRGTGLVVEVVFDV